MQNFRQNNQGQIIGTSNGRDYILNPNVIRENRTGISRTNDYSSTSSPFKLLTIRKFNNQSIEQLRTNLINSQQLLENTALRNNQPVPFPAPDINNENLNRFFAVYIDEDLYGLNQPAYTFYSPDVNIKAFVTANGAGKEDYSIHIAYVYQKERNPDNNFNIYWRLFTIDKNLNDSTLATYTLDSKTLPECFSSNVALDGLSYLGGGCWSLYAIEDKDKIKVINFVQKQETRVKRLATNSELGIVSQSITPSYNMTWCRGELKLNYRERDAIERTDIDFLLDSGVISNTKESNYSLNICYRPQYSEISKIEYSNNSATFVGNTNISVNSPFQSPDYGTDTARYSLQKYNQKTNCVRKKQYITSNVNTDKSSNPGNLLPVLTSSNDNSKIMYLNLGEAEGNINHPYELKYTRGERGIMPYYQYRYWWTYGKILSFEVVGDTGIYLVRRNESVIYIADISTKGEVKLDPDVGNRILTTWEAEPVKSGFFGQYEALIQFNITYLNPPIMGHTGIFYYHYNPITTIQGVASGEVDEINLDVSGSSSYNTPAPVIGTFGGDIDDDRVKMLNTYRSIYGQMLGGVGGPKSLNIGNVVIGAREKATIIARKPDEEQRGFLFANPNLYPNGFFDGLIDFQIKNNNSGYKIIYDIEGNIISSEEF